MNYKDHITKFDYLIAKRLRKLRFKYMLGGKVRKINTAWFRGKQTNFLPRKSDLYDTNGLEEYVFKGWIPDEPFINKDTNIIILGSCFAWEISKYFAANNFTGVLTNDSLDGVLQVPEGISEGVNNTFAIRQLFEWAWLDQHPESETWHRKDRTIIERNKKYQQETSARFSKAEVFIITLGLSEVWYDKETNDVFWRAIPLNQFDENKHAFRVTTVEENKANLQAVIDLISTHAPNAEIIFTLSPVPLQATFRPVSCITASSVSKSILRVAVDEIAREYPDIVHYWPSYEMVKEYAQDPYMDDNRHITKQIVGEIMDNFVKYYVNDSD